VRIVAVADTHLRHGELVIPDGDVLIHAGDLCERGGLDEVRATARWLAALPHAHKVVIAGNHDWAFVHDPAAARALFDGMTYLEDEEVTVGGLRCYGSPWQPYFCNWAFNLRRGEALAAVWAKIPVGLDVLITHGPPAGFGDLTWSERVGCEDLRRRVAAVKPRLHLFGHIHEDGGLWRDGETVFANVTTAYRARGATVIDVDAAGVTAVVVPGSIRG
jgi:predicted phosphohydrolase